VVPALVRLCRSLEGVVEMTVRPGADLTHVRPGLIERTARAARERGAAVVLVHGETIVEPVLPGTNRAAIEAGVDVLAHPGLLTEADARLAAERGVHLEISGRKGHSFTNGLVAQMSRLAGARLVFGSDAHDPGDLMERSEAEAVARGAGLTEAEIAAMFEAAEALIRR